ncbi:hypothetical protein [Enterococcus rotai]|uniref:hypothetical protein n=1 Tax=Enterococcus rotai TaxID=118060 RepID=UPI0032B45CA6
MKKPQDHKVKKYTEQDHLRIMKEFREGKNVDNIAATFLEVLGLYGVTVEETSALLFYVMKTVLQQPHNKSMLDQLHIDINAPTETSDGTVTPVDKVLDIQRIYLGMYYEKLSK